MTAPLCLSLFQLCHGQYDAVWRKLSAQRATADTAAELGCGISPHVSFRSARLRIGVMLRSLRCRDHAVTWCAGRESCRSLDGSRTAQTDQSRSFCSRNHKNCCLADEPLKKQKSSRNVRRALLRLSPYRVARTRIRRKGHRLDRAFFRADLACVLLTSWPYSVFHRTVGVGATGSSHRCLNN